MDQLGVLLLAGLTNGSVYGLVGLSLSLIYGTARIINFAQGEFVMLGTMSAITFLVGLTMPVQLAIPAVLGVALLAAVLVEVGVYRTLLARGAPPLTIMIGTLAAAIIIAGGALLAWGPQQRYMPSIFSLDVVRFGPLTTNNQQLAIIATFAIFLLVAWFLLYRTSFGLSVRVTGVNPRVALLMGVRSARVVRFGFIFSAAVSAMVGVLIGPLLGGQVSMGIALTVKGFMAAILGGLGSPFASAAGGVLIALVEALVASYGSSLYAEPIIFALLLVILFFRPYGLLGDFEAVKR